MLTLLIKKKEAAISRMKEMVALAEKEERVMTEEETEEFGNLQSEVTQLKSQIELAKSAEATFEAEEEAEVATPVKSASATALSQTGPIGEPAKKKFESLAEFVAVATLNRNDSRLTYEQYPQAEQSYQDGSKGGFLVPTEFREEFLKIEAAPSFVRPRARVLTPGARPDAEIELPALDQRASSDGTHNVYGGVEVVHTEEGETMSETDADIRLIKWKPKEISGYVQLTNKLLRNWSSAQSMISDLLIGAKYAAEDNDFMVGNGVGKSQGFIPSAAAYDVNRAGSGAIAFADIKAMYSRFHGSEANAVWAVSHSAFPELLDITGDGGGATNVIGYDSSGNVASFYGIPIVRPGRGLPALGTKGDLVLVDLSYYVIKDGSGPFIDASEHVEWKKNKTLVKIVWNVDGHPWLTEPFKNELDYDVSPFVVLDVPA